MGKRISYPPGTFSWVELSTTDPEGAERFYGELFGWSAVDNEMPEGVYTVAQLDGESVAGIVLQPEQQVNAGVPPHWFSYVTVADADSSAARAAELGGALHAGPFDAHEAGRMAVIADPAGAMFGIWQAGESIGAGIVNAPGALIWNELATRDVKLVSAFYSGLFDWRIEETATDGGPRYWMIGHEGAASGQNGAMREQGPAEEGIPPNWAPYFAANSVDVTLGRIEELGGSTIVPATDIPAGRFASARDPQGAVFSIFEGDFDD